jgi:hypothetical protein
VLNPERELVNKKDLVVYLGTMNKTKREDGGDVEGQPPAKRYIPSPLTHTRRESGHLPLLDISGLPTAHLAVTSSARRQRGHHTPLWCDTLWFHGMLYLWL